MTELENKILRALVDLEDAVKRMPHARPKPNLVPLFAQIDNLARQLPDDSHPRLLHYLHKRSYEKALLFLQGRGTEIVKGMCDGSKPVRTPGS